MKVLVIEFAVPLFFSYQGQISNSWFSLDPRLVIYDYAQIYVWQLVQLGSFSGYSARDLVEYQLVQLGPC